MGTLAYFLQRYREPGPSGRKPRFCPEGSGAWLEWFCDVKTLVGYNLNLVQARGISHRLLETINALCKTKRDNRMTLHLVYKSWLPPHNPEWP